MKLTLSPTSTFATVAGTNIRVRLWKGADAAGTPVHAYVVAVSPQTHDAALLRDFDRGLQPNDELKLTAEPQTFDMRFIL